MRVVDMATDYEIRALYFPYARSFDSNFLKQSLLLFDSLSFVDPLERAAREALEYGDPELGFSARARWSRLKDDYAYLESGGFINVIDPFPIVREYDGLMAQAMLCDLHDASFMRLASEFGSQDYWGILRNKIPPDSLMADATSFYGTRFWRTPNSISSPRDPSSRYGSFQDFSSPFLMSVAHDYIPVACGYSVNTNLALLLGQLTGLVPLTDDPNAVRLLSLKHQRAMTAQEDAPHPSSLIVKRSPRYLQMYSVVAANVADALLPNGYIESRSFEEIARFKQNEQEAFDRFKATLFEFVSQISSDPWTKEFEIDIVKLIDGKVLPESQKTRDQLTAAYEKMFGSLIRSSAATATPTLVASLLAGLSQGKFSR